MRSLILCDRSNYESEFELQKC